MLDDLTSLHELTSFLNWNAFLFLILTLALLLLGRFANQALVKYNLGEQLMKADNKAVALSFSGFLLSIGLVLQGVLSIPSPTGLFWDDVKSILIWGGVGCVFLLISRIVNDRFILPKFSNQKELVEHRNVGVGAVQAGGYISTAYIIRGVLLGEDSSFLNEALLYAVIGFLTSQVLLLAYAMVYKRIYPFNLEGELARENPAVGVSFAGSLVAFGILVSFYLQSFDSIIGLILWVLIAFFLLKGVHFLVDKLLLPSAGMDEEISKDKNWGVGLIDAVTSILAAFILTGALF